MIRVVWLGYLVSLAVLSSCLDTATEFCADGVICPRGLTCHATLERCVAPALRTCGDGVLDSDEVCDDGNMEPGDSCSEDCRSDYSCGNGIVDEPDGDSSAEQCDCGSSDDIAIREHVAIECAGMANSDLGGYCKSDCTLHCGDGDILAGVEECDIGNLGERNCLSESFDVGVLACSASCLLDTSTCGRIGWYLDEFPSVQPVIRTVWGSDSRNVFAAGDSGMILHYDGETWRELPRPQTSVSLLAISGTDENNVYIVGENGTVLRYNGERATFEPTPQSVPLVGVWASDANNVLALSASGRLWNRSVQSSPNDDDVLSVSWREDRRIADAIDTIWIRGADDFYAVLDTGRLRHYRGGSIVDDIPEDGVRYRAIWGDDDHVFAVGDGGAIRHYDGFEWRSVELEQPLETNLTSVWGTSADNVFVAGLDGVMLRWNGLSWKRLNTRPNLDEPDRPYQPQQFTSVWSSGPSEVYAVDIGDSVAGRGIWRSDGLEWAFNDSAPVTGPIKALWGVRADDIHALANNGTYMHYDGVSWGDVFRLQLENNPLETPPVYMNALWGRSDGSMIAVGDEGVVFHHDGLTWWQDEYVSRAWNDGGAAPDLQAVWSSDNGEMFIAGGRALNDGRAGMLLHYNPTGDSWSAMEHQATADFSAIWGRATDDVYATSTDGGLYGFKGDTEGVWASIWTNGFEQPALFGISGTETSVYAVGAVRETTRQSTIVRYIIDDDRVIESDIPLDVDLHAVWAIADDNIYVAGDSGAIMHFDGTQWSAVSLFTERTLHSVWGTGDVMVVAGDEGLLATLFRDDLRHLLDSKQVGTP